MAGPRVSAPSLAKEKTFEPWPLPIQLTPKQQAFYDNDELEALYGGAAGGAKTEGGLAAALKFVHIPGYNALILMRSYTDLTLPDAIMDRAESWLSGTQAKWKEQKKTWVFPSGATLTFGYLATKKDRLRYKSAQFHFCFFDELTQFEFECYRYMFSRMRKTTNLNVPIRMRAATNPDGPHADWVRRRFIPQEFLDASVETRFSKTWEKPALDQNNEVVIRYFHPARLEDNPHVNAQEYIYSLGNLDEVTYAQLRRGDWEITHKGKKFQKKWFQIVDPDAVPLRTKLKLVRSWDIAHTAPEPGQDPDWSVGTLIGLDEETDIRFVLDVVRFQGGPSEVNTKIERTARKDGQLVPIVIEQEPAGGKRTIDFFVTQLMGYDVRGYRPAKDKETRANPVAALAARGYYKIVSADWNEDWLEEIASFPHGTKKDQVDSLSQGDAFFAEGKVKSLMQWSRDHHLISGHQAQNILGVGVVLPGYGFRPPERWNVFRSIFVDELGSQPGACVWLARPPEGEPNGLGTAGFVFKMATLSAAMAPSQIIEDISRHEQPFRNQIRLSLLPPNAKKLQEAYSHYLRLPFGLWDKDPRSGLASLRTALRIDPKQRHPFVHGLMGRPNLYLVVPASQIEKPVDDLGLLSLRQGIESYYHDEKKGGAEIVEYPSLRALLGIAAVLFGHSEPLSESERLESRLPAPLRLGAINPGPMWANTRRVIIEEIDKEDDGATEVSPRPRFIG